MAWHIEYPQIWFTFGPQTKDAKIIEELIRAGATGARMAFSYGTPQLQIERCHLIRSVASSLGRSMVLIADLQGEKCRLARMINSEQNDINEIPVRAGSSIILAKGIDDIVSDSMPSSLPVQNPNFIDKLSVGDIVVYGDGELLLAVLQKRPDSVMCSVNHDGILHPGRGFVIRSSNFRPASITPKDRYDLEIICSSGAFDAVALSFVASAEDIETAQAIMRLSGKTLPIIAKIETELGVKNIDGLTEVADGLMAARGDLALTAPWVELPSLMSEIVKAARKYKKPWILATQLVEGLEHFTFPTRAEICDLARWMLEGASGAMLSYETAFGSRPVDAVEAVSKIVHRYKMTPPP